MQGMITGNLLLKVNLSSIVLPLEKNLLGRVKTLEQLDKIQVFGVIDYR